MSHVDIRVVEFTDRVGSNRGQPIAHPDGQAENLHHRLVSAVARSTAIDFLSLIVDRDTGLRIAPAN